MLHGPLLCACIRSSLLLEWRCICSLVERVMLAAAWRLGKRMLYALSRALSYTPRSAPRSAPTSGLVDLPGWVDRESGSSLYHLHCIQLNSACSSVQLDFHPLHYSLLRLSWPETHTSPALVYVTQISQAINPDDTNPRFRCALLVLQYTHVAILDTPQTNSTGCRNPGNCVPTYRNYDTDGWCGRTECLTPPSSER